MIRKFTSYLASDRVFGSHRYLCEFDFRYNERSALGVEDAERSVKAVKGIEGKRLMYRPPHSR